jgi:poly-gamma-glutamate synthesis protein (capsule biosynthesis protein)
VRWQPSHNYDLVKLDSEATPADFYDARSEKGSRGFPADSVYWESVVARCEWSGGTLKEVRLLPIDLGFERPRSQRGRPVFAGADLSRKVLERVARLSKPFGTTIKRENGAGLIRV